MWKTTRGLISTKLTASEQEYRLETEIMQPFTLPGPPGHFNQALICFAISGDRVEYARVVMRVCQSRRPRCLNKRARERLACRAATHNCSTRSQTVRIAKAQEVQCGEDHGEMLVASRPEGFQVTQELVEDYRPHPRTGIADSVCRSTQQFRIAVTENETLGAL